MSTYDVTVDMTLDVDVTMAENAYDVSADIGEFTYIGSYETYQGSYDVTPTSAVQTLDTNDKLMTDDVTVRAIPYYETRNVSGTTIYIGTL